MLTSYKILFFISKYIMQVLHCLIHASSELGAWCLFVIVIPWFNENILVLFTDSNIFVLVKWEKVFLVVLVIKNYLSLRLWSGVVNLFWNSQIVLLESLLLFLRVYFLHKLFLDGCPKGLWWESLLLRLSHVGWLRAEVWLLRHWVNIWNFYTARSSESGFIWL